MEQAPQDLLTPTTKFKPIQPGIVRNELAGLENLMQLVNDPRLSKDVSPADKAELLHTIAETGSAIPEGAQAPVPKPARTISGIVHDATTAAPTPPPQTGPGPLSGVSGAGGASIPPTVNKNFFFTGQSGAGKSYIANRARKLGARVVSRVETLEDFNSLVEAGWQHYHVCCTKNALQLRKRRASSDGALAAALDKQVSEKINQPGDRLRVIFNDDGPKCPERLYSVDQWLSEIVNPPKPPDPDPIPEGIIL